VFLYERPTGALRLWTRPCKEIFTHGSGSSSLVWPFYRDLPGRRQTRGGGGGECGHGRGVKMERVRCIRRCMKETAI
jgi:hypothetical protein